MESEVITPAPGQSVIRTDSHHHDRGDRRGGSSKWARAILAGQADGFARAAQAHTDTIGSIKDGTCTAVEAIKDARGDVVTAVKDARYDLAQVAERGFAAGAAASCHLGQRVADGFTDVERSLCSGFEGVNGTVVHASEIAQAALCGVSREIAEATKETVVGFKDAQALAYQVEGRAALNGERIGNAAAVQATSNFNLSTVQTERVRAELAQQADRHAAAAELAAVKNAAAAELRAQQLAAEAAKQLAECCCELKEQHAATRSLVTAESNRVIAVVESQELARLRDELNDQKAAVRDAELKRLICCGCGTTDRRDRGRGND